MPDESLRYNEAEMVEGTVQTIKNIRKGVASATLHRPERTGIGSTYS